MTMDSGVKFQLIHLPAMNLCSKLLNLLSLPICKMEIFTIPTSQQCEDN